MTAGLSHHLLILMGVSLSAMVLVAGCAPDTGVSVRIENASPYPFDAVTVHFPDQVVAFGAVSPGASTEFVSVSRAYAYAYTELSSEGRQFVVQPIDFVGERTLAPGRYTYAVSVDLLPDPITVADRTIHGYGHIRLVASEDEP